MDKIPSWDDAPSWAHWLAQDSNGRWHWYSDRPELGLYWIPAKSSTAFPAGTSNVVEPAKALQEKP